MKPKFTTNLKIEFLKQSPMKMDPTHAHTLNQLALTLYMFMVVIFMNSCSNTTTPNYSDSFLDTRDGQRYKYVTIGNQIWMAENMNFDTADKVGSWCYHDSDYYCNVYGRLYNWATAMGIDSSYNSKYWGKNTGLHRGICPIGWHIPSDNEWGNLFFTTGNSDTTGKNLKSINGWDTADGIDLYGFDALPSGNYNHGIFENLGDEAAWITTSEIDSIKDNTVLAIIIPTFRYLWAGPPQDSKQFGFSLRCIKD